MDNLEFLRIGSIEDSPCVILEELVAKGQNPPLAFDIGAAKITTALPTRVADSIKDFQVILAPSHPSLVTLRALLAGAGMQVHIEPIPSHLVLVRGAVRHSKAYRVSRESRTALYEIALLISRITQTPIRVNPTLVGLKRQFRKVEDYAIQGNNISMWIPSLDSLPVKYQRKYLAQQDSALGVEALYPGETIH